MGRDLNRYLHFFARIVFFATAFLLVAGALVTGTGSGLAVPDWPLSFGQYMPPMVGGVFYEHGHRMVAGSVGFLTLGLTTATILIEKRFWVRALSMICLATVLFQAILGGLTVIYRLPASVSIAHACTAQIFFCLVTLLMTATSKAWKEVSKRPPLPTGLWKMGLIGMTLVFTQVLLGAVMRHFGAGLAIPDFPKAFGNWIPPLENFEIAIHFSHRIFALIVSAFVLFLLLATRKRASDNTWLIGISGALFTLVLVQFLLGALVIWTGKVVAITTLHLLVGGLCFSTMGAYTFVAARIEGLKPGEIIPRNREAVPA